MPGTSQWHTRPPCQEQADRFNGIPCPKFGPARDAMLYCYMGGGVTWQPSHVSAVVCRARSQEAALSMLLTARLLSLRGPSPTAAAVTIGSIKAEVFDSPSRAAERENSFLQAAESAAATLSLTLQSKHRGDWRPMPRLLSCWLRGLQAGWAQRTPCLPQQPRMQPQLPAAVLGSRHRLLPGRVPDTSVPPASCCHQTLGVPSH